MCFLEQGGLASAAVLQTITASCVANGCLGDCGPSCLEIIHKLPLCSSGGILHLSDDHPYRTRGNLAWSPRPRAMDSCLMLLPFTNNRTNSCLLLTNLLADGFVTHSSLVQVYNHISDFLGQLFGLAHGGEVECVKYDSLDRFLLYTSPVEIRCTLLGLMRTNLCASWAHNWSLGARILAVCLGVQILFCIKYKYSHKCYKMQFSGFVC